MKKGHFVLPVGPCVLYLYCNLNLTTMFTKENASIYGSRGGIATMSNPEHARAIGRAGGLAGGKKQGPILGRKNVEDGTLDRAREQRTVNYLKRWYNLLFALNREFTTADIARVSDDMGISIGCVKSYLRKGIGCRKVRHGYYERTLQVSDILMTVR